MDAGASNEMGNPGAGADGAGHMRLQLPLRHQSRIENKVIVYENLALVPVLKELTFKSDETGNNSYTIWIIK